MLFSEELEKYSWDEITKQIYAKTEADVARALTQEHLQIEDFMALISPAAERYLEEMAVRSRMYTQQRFGKTISMYIPMYITNSCTNFCVYCGFNHNNPINRIILTDEEIVEECKAIRRLGPFENLLIVTGENPHLAGVDYLENALRLARPYFHELSFPDLRYLVVTAEASDADLLEAFRPCIPHAEIINLYGPTEATIYCTRYTVPAHGCKQHNGMVAIGKTFAEMKAVIVGEDGQPLPTDTTGELWLSGPQLMTGYWQQPELTAQCFVRRDGRLYYRTGDLCRRDADGDLIYCGRKDNQVKIQGFRIELGEIEHCAKEFYAHRCNAVVLALQGEGGCEQHLVVERAPEDTASLMQHLQSRLPAYMLPKRIHVLPVFPLNKSNKTDRPRIRQLIG